jgi:hypothetical protein
MRAEGLDYIVWALVVIASLVIAGVLWGAFCSWRSQHTPSRWTGRLWRPLRTRKGSRYPGVRTR